MLVLKERQFLVFYLDIEKGDELGGRTVRYNLATQETIGIKGGVVKSLHSQLGNHSIGQIIESIDDEKYKEFLKKVHKFTGYGNWGSKTYTKFGTLLEKAKEYKWVESFVVAGITEIKDDLHVELKDIPKWLIKYVKGDFDGVKKVLSKTLLRTYDKNPVLFQNMFNHVTSKDSDLEFEWNTVLSYFSRLVELIEDYNYEYKALLNYISNIMRFEGEDRFYAVIEMIDSEIYMRTQMAKFAGNTKIDKYWRYLRTTHNVTIRIYNKFKTSYDEKLFKDTVDLSYEYESGEYCIVHPKCIDDVKKEAIMQSNCVATYVDRIIKGVCRVVFLRKVENKECSVVTVEIRNNEIVQRLGAYNTEPKKEELDFLEKYSKKVLTPKRK